MYCALIYVKVSTATSKEKQIVDLDGQVVEIKVIVRLMHLGQRFTVLQIQF